jgi:hypothetical protein
MGLNELELGLTKAFVYDELIERHYEKGINWSYVF